MESNGVRYYLVVLLVSISFIIVGCSAMKPKMPPMASIEGISGNYRIGQIVCLDTGMIIPFEQLINQLESRDVIFLGEVHNNPDHHLIQVQILQALMARSGHLTVAMEFFQEPLQPILDLYMGGVIKEGEFLKKAEWGKRWNFDYHFYRPLVLQVKEKGGRILAINAPNEIVKKVARLGLNSLEPDERNQLASNIDLKNDSHRAYLHKVFKKHTHHELKSFDFFYQAQCVWEDTMAENIARSLEDNKKGMVVIAGNGHIINKFGIPGRTSKRVPITLATIILYPLTGQITLDKEMGDYVWLTGNYSLRHQNIHHRLRHRMRIPPG